MCYRIYLGSFTIAGINPWKAVNYTPIFKYHISM